MQPDGRAEKGLQTKPWKRRAMKGLEASRIGLHLGDFAERLGALGDAQIWPPGAFLCRRDEASRALHVILEGNVAFDNGGFGPGAHMGEIGFLLGVPRTADIVAETPVKTWTIEFDSLSRDAAAGAVLVCALALELPSRTRKLRPLAPPREAFCDADHPAIMAQAAALSHPTPQDTAQAIWEFVMAFPYRFGVWWQRASDTLAQGWGMCTTKSNLQVALMRAAGLEAGFVEVAGDAMMIKPLIPKAWHSSLRPSMTHFLAAVRLNDRWHAADASFTRPVLQHFEACFPMINGLHRERLGLGRPFHPAARFSGRDPFDIAVLNSLDHAMASRSSHDIDRLEVMNVVVDRLQGLVFDAPLQVLQARRLLNADPTMAFQLALSVAVSRAHELRNRILEPA